MLLVAREERGDAFFFLMIRRPPRSTLFPYTTLFRSWEAAPGALLSGPDTGAYSAMTWTPDPQRGVSWTQRFAGDERDPAQIADVTQHFYVGGDPGKTSTQQAIANMLSAEWLRGTAPGSQPRGTTYTPYP